jgi:signal transduction histidine kinase
MRTLSILATSVVLACLLAYVAPVRAEGPFVLDVVEIKDNGRGIPKHRVIKIFDPGFTTKGVGAGTGPGLSICYQIIHDHKGEIRVDSKVGESTTFTIVLPVDLE